MEGIVPKEGTKGSRFRRYELVIRLIKITEGVGVHGPDPDRILSRDGPRQGRDSKSQSPFHGARPPPGIPSSLTARRRPSPSLAWINAIASSLDTV